VIEVLQVLGLPGVSLHRPAKVGGGDLRSLSGRKEVVGAFGLIAATLCPLPKFLENLFPDPECAILRALSLPDGKRPAHEVDVF